MLTLATELKCYTLHTHHMHMHMQNRVFITKRHTTLAEQVTLI